MEWVIHQWCFWLLHRTCTDEGLISVHESCVKASGEVPLDGWLNRVILRTMHVARRELLRRGYVLGCDRRGIFFQ